MYAILSQPSLSQPSKFLIWNIEGVGAKGVCKTLAQNCSRHIIVGSGCEMQGTSYTDPFHVPYTYVA